MLKMFFVTYAQQNLRNTNQFTSYQTVTIFTLPTKLLLQMSGHELDATVV